ncbi:hypothetical protein G9A89_007108 [Geosiphon pyriformis]|nr:hypothetical protein G9A89_007108 [Geosiphon pyriformis]
MAAKDAYLPLLYRQWNSGTGNSQNLNVQHYLSLLVISENTLPNNQKPNQYKLLTNNIPPATVTNDKLLATIFPFELEETTPVLLFSGATLNTKLITTMYTDTKVDAMCDHFKLTNMLAPLIGFEEEEKKPIWKAYQVSWADKNHNELPPIFFWDNNNKGKQKEEPT